MQTLAELIMRFMLLMVPVFLLMAGCQSPGLEKLLGPKQPPLEDSIYISIPDKRIPEKYAVYSGLWEGGWLVNRKNLLKIKFAVQKIDTAGNARGVYAWGDDPLGRFDAGNSHFRGEINKGILKLTFSNGAYATFEIESKNTLNGIYSIGGKKSYGKFFKRDLE
ncbi:MAG: hypothetical protein C0631_12390 [Sedimenticola sp.]|nr:MAG: hypothetical protein C0631_12390 [Sedimenticola sp.]